MNADQAAIKRATIAAQREVVALDAAALKELEQLYQAAADDIAQRIAAQAGSDGNVMLEELQSLLAQVRARLKQLSDARDELLNKSLGRSVDLGVIPLAGAAAMQSLAAMQINQEALDFVRHFVGADGLQLSDRIWRLDRHARDVVINSIEQAIIQGHGAAQAARELLMRGEVVPGDIADKMGAGNAQAMGKAAGALLTGEGSPMVNAMRLMRTEINRAHGTAYAKGALAHPDAAGVRFLLSPGHPKPDVCLRRGTFVATKRGDVPIEQVVVGDMALTHQGRFKPVTRLYRSSSGQTGLVRLCCRAGNSRSLEAVMTPNHPVLTPQGWIPAGDLRTGCHVVCVDAAEVLPLQLCGAGVGRKGLTGSGEIASAGAARNTSQGLCDALRSLLRRTPRIDLSGGQRPTCSPMSGVAMRLPSCCRRATRGFRLAAASLTATAGIGLNAQTSLDGACRSSDWLHHFEEHRRWSNISDCCGSCWRKIFYRTSDRSMTARHGLFDSRRQNKKHAGKIQSCFAVPQIFFDIQGRQAQPAYPGSSIVQSTCDYKTAWLSCAALAQIAQGLVQVAWRNIRKIWRWTYENYILFTPKHTTVAFLPATGEEVFNLEVEDDHSYIANGIVVHNCDLLSTQNLHGLGPGVYPTVEGSGWPAHPNTLSFLEIVFKDEVTDADRAGKETSMEALARLTPEQRKGVLGANKAEVFDQGKMSKGMIRSKWSAVQKRIG